MAARSIASLSLSFGLVSIPVKLYSATESSAAVRFKLMAPGGARLRQQYVADEAPADEPLAPPPAEASRPARSALRREASERVLDFPAPRRELPVEEPEPEVVAPAVVERADMVKGYEFEKGRFVLFTAEELKALAEESRQSIDIVSFIPERSVDPLYYDKAYFLVPDKRGAKPYSLLLRAMQDTGRCALAKWAWRSKEYVVQVRPAEGGMVLQQLLYAEEVRSLADLNVDIEAVGEAELELARRLIGQISEESYDPARFVDEEKRRILAAVEHKIAGQEIVSSEPRETLPATSNVVDLMAALRASLAPAAAAEAPAARRKAKAVPRRAATPAPRPLRRS